MKTALITGASSDIGVEIVEILKSEYIVYAHVHTNKDVIQDRFKKEIEKGTLHIIVADLSSNDGASIISNEISDVDLIVFVAGYEIHGLFTDLTDDELTNATNMHLLSPIKIARNLIPAMVKKKNGNIIFISSIWGIVGASNEVIYSSLKGAQNTLVKSLAKELAPSNIRVNAIAPGAVATKMLHVLDDEEMDWLCNEIPMGRLATPAEVAKSVRYLSSKSSSYITGVILPVTGGWNIT